VSTDQWADENGNPMFDRTADGERTRPVEIDDTTRRMREDPAEGLLFLAEAMGSRGSDGAIEAMEKRGQQQLVNSDRLPSEYEAAALAKLIDRLADASPGVHRALAEQVRAAASVAFGAGVMEELR